MSSVIIPARPPHPRIMDTSERIKMYGSPCRMGAAGNLIVDPAWERKNIVTLFAPWPTSRPVHGFTLPIKVHVNAAQAFRDLFNAWKDADLLDRLKTFNGAYNCRMKRGKENSLLLSDLSTHSFGAAIDLNAAYNAFGAKPAALGEVGCLLELVQLAAAHGFVWGGDWKKPDGMHFELGVIEAANVVHH